ncbi:MAG: DHH family phosphoesterase, partial [Campylobacterales bacterium]|nr:DHH family phosphoesterase [Campylobacterales bacterium]
PRLNSAGRMDDASVAYNFLNAKTVEEASYFLEELDRLNNFRKTKEKEILDLAKNQYREQDDVIVVWGEDWHEGVIGIVAARLTDLYNKPSIVFSVIGEKAKGSGRSNPNVDLLKLITSSSEHLEGFGGHKQAAGMGCKTSSLESFKEACLTNFQEENNIEEVIFKDVFGKLSLDLVNMNLVGFLGQFEPYGQAFPFPQFFAHHVVPKKILKMGADKSHMLLVFEVAPYTTVSAVWFNYDREISENETLSFIYTVGKNSFRGKEEAQIQIRKVL